MNLREEALHWALSQLGVHEIGGANRGPAVEAYLRAAGLAPGNPWCAAFCNWCGEQAAKNQKVVSPLESITAQGYVQAYFEWARRSGYLIDLKQALPGDLFCVWHSSLGRFAHMGFVSYVLSDHVFKTCEGNSNSTHSREGIMVCSNNRSVEEERIALIRWTRVVNPI